MDNQDKVVYDVGSEAKGSYGIKNTGSLSLERADKVRHTLAGLLSGSVLDAEDRLVSISAGDKLPWRSEPDFFKKSGARNEAVSEKNRAVWLIPETAEDKIQQLRYAGFI